MAPLAPFFDAPPLFFSPPGFFPPEAASAPLAPFFFLGMRRLPPDEGFFFFTFPDEEDEDAPRELRRLQPDVRVADEEARDHRRVELLPCHRHRQREHEILRLRKLPLALREQPEVQTVVPLLPELKLTPHFEQLLMVLPSSVFLLYLPDAHCLQVVELVLVPAMATYLPLLQAPISLQLVVLYPKFHVCPSRPNPLSLLLVNLPFAHDAQTESLVIVPAACTCFPAGQCLNEEHLVVAVPSLSSLRMLDLSTAGHQSGAKFGEKPIGMGPGPKAVIN